MVIAAIVACARACECVCVCTPPDSNVVRNKHQVEVSDNLVFLKPDTLPNIDV